MGKVSGTAGAKNKREKQSTHGHDDAIGTQVSNRNKQQQ